MHWATNDWDTLCAICASPDAKGDLRLRQIHPEPGEPVDVFDLETMCLCSGCFGLLRSVVSAGVRREGNLDHLPNLPLRYHPAPGAEACEICWAPFQGDWFTFEFMGAARVPAVAFLRFVDRTLRVRACTACVTWLRDVIDEESIARWTHRRAQAVPGSSFAPPRPLRVAGFQIGAKDEAVLKETLSALGCTYRASRSVTQGPVDVYFLSVDGADDEALRSVPPSILDRTVVVTAPERAEDALHLMRAGARDLLVSPLSRQQVTGALDRLSDPDAFAGRDIETGLPSYSPSPRFGMPCHLVAVEPPEGVAGLEVFLTLRRFLRGFDRVGLDSGPLVPVALYCPEDNLERVMGRIKGVLGEGFQVRLLATVTGAIRLEDDPEIADLRAKMFPPDALLRRAS